MIGSFLTNGLIMALGYAYPAYECYKIIDKNKPEIEQLRFWCQYWILVAMLTIFDRVGGDTFVSWLPMFSEAKLAFYIYLWFPKTRGSTYVYTLFQPYVAKHQVEIDRCLLELRSRAGDVVILYVNKVAVYGRTRFLEILQYVASQSQPQPPIVPASIQKPIIAPASPPPATKVPASPSKVSNQSRPRPPTAKPIVPASPPPATQVSNQSGSGSNERSSDVQSEEVDEATTVQAVQVEDDEVVEKEEEDAPTTSSNPNTPQNNNNNNPKETTSVMEETIRFSRGRLRKTRSSYIPGGSIR